MLTCLRAVLQRRCGFVPRALPLARSHPTRRRRVRTLARAPVSPSLRRCRRRVASAGASECALKCLRGVPQHRSARGIDVRAKPCAPRVEAPRPRSQVDHASPLFVRPPCARRLSPCISALSTDRRAPRARRPTCSLWIRREVRVDRKATQDGAPEPCARAVDANSADLVSPVERTQSQVRARHKQIGRTRPWLLFAWRGNPSLTGE